MPRLPIVGKSVNQTVSQAGENTRRMVGERISNRTSGLANVPRRTRENAGEFKQRYMQKMQASNEAGGRG